jgi:hypothetical protein
MSFQQNQNANVKDREKANEKGKEIRMSKIQQTKYA